MDAPQDTSPQTAPARTWQEQLRSPMRMSIFVLGSVFAMGLALVHMPLLNRMEVAGRRLQNAQKRHELAQEIVKLRQQAAAFEGRLPRGVNLTEWTEYLLNGARQTRVKVLRLEPKEVGKLGPCQVPEWRIELEGQFVELGRFVQWLEAGERVMRIDQIVVEPSDSQLKMSLQVKGLTL
jgi:hypothetical protein